MSEQESVLIVGCGIFGITGALELHQRGHRVTVVDPGPLPTPHASSTDISKAVRNDYADDEIYVSMMDEAFQGWAEWNERWGIELFHRTGMMFMTREEMRPGGFEYESFRFLTGRGHSLERVDSDGLRMRFPKWNAEKYVDGYLNPEGGWAESGAVVSRLIQEARLAGIEIREGFATQELIWEGASVMGAISSEGEEIRADLTLVAAGAWTPSLLPHLENVMESVGQPLLYFKPSNPEEFQPPSFPTWAADVSNTGWYGFPVNSEGILKVARHGTGYKLSPDPANRVPEGEEARFRNFLRETFLDLAEAELVGSRICYYCDTFDGHFWIDRDPEHRGLAVAAGGSGHAFKFAPVLGPLIADAIERKDRSFDSRFRWRDPTKSAQAADRARSKKP